MLRMENEGLQAAIRCRRLLHLLSDGGESTPWGKVVTLALCFFQGALEERYQELGLAKRPRSL
jgi:hypothetical protein